MSVARKEQADRLIMHAAKLVKEGHLAYAVSEYFTSLQLNPKNAIAHFEVGIVLMRLGYLDKAESHVGIARNLNPNLPDAWMVLARIYEQTSRLEIAERTIRRASKRFGDAFRGDALLARIYRRTRRAMQAIELLDGAKDTDEVCVERAKSLEKLARYDEAWEQYTLANQLHASKHPWQDMMKSERDRLERFRKQELKFGTYDGNPPRFVVGFPRSGTTLTEQILSSHPSISCLSEHSPIRSLGEEHDMVSATEDQIRELRKTYEEGMRAYFRLQGDPDDPPCPVDKMPLNIVNIGHINMMYPNAPVIVCIRDPRDVCLSCFFQRFRINPALANFLTIEDTVKFYTMVMGFWLEIRDRLTLPWMQLSYEGLTDLPQKWCARMLSHLGVDWNPRVMDFYKIQRGITTPSYETVNTPINSAAVGRWRHYEKHVAEHYEALNPFLKEFGYKKRA